MAEPPTVVVVEDDPHIADLVELYLRQAGMRVHQAGDGERALDVVRARRPDVVVLDIGLPGALDGLDVCRALRAEQHSTPIIFLTARDVEFVRVLCMDIG